MRFRGDFYRESFFGTMGTIATPTSPVTPTEPSDPSLPVGLDPLDDPVTDIPVTVEPTNPIAELQDDAVNDVATDDGQNDEVPTYTLEEVKDLIGTIRPTATPIYYPHPTLPGTSILVTENGGTLVTTSDTPATVISGGFGGGGGAMVEEEEDFTEKIAKPTSPKNTILWLVIGAVVIYFGYKYLVKKN